MLSLAVARLYHIVMYNCGDSLAAIFVRKSGDPDKIYYVHKDHLGSIVKLTDGNGTTVFKASYDVWGKQTVTNNTFAFHRGYTGHEHLNEFGLINMNGRMYDPNVGRFLSPDPFVQAPDFSQSFNRYSYCLNNPLIYTDPTGEFLATIFGAVSDFIVNTFVKSWSQGFNAWSNPKNWNTTLLGWEIDKGLVYTDSNKSIGGQIWELFSRFTWQLPQTLAGYTFVSGANAFRQVNDVTHKAGVTAVDMGLPDGKAITIGNYSSGPKGYKADWQDHLFVHEYGHYIQSQQYGLVYIPVIGLPSLFSALE